MRLGPCRLFVEEAIRFRTTTSAAQTKLSELPMGPFDLARRGECRGLSFRALRRLSRFLSVRREFRLLGPGTRRSQIRLGTFTSRTEADRSRYIFSASPWASKGDMNSLLMVFFVTMPETRP